MSETSAERTKSKLSAQIEVFERYSALTGIPVEELLDKAIEEYINDVAPGLIVR